MNQAYTVEEVRHMFLHQVRGLAKYWAELPNKTPRERCDGVAFSLLNLFDGTTLILPAMEIRLAPHPDDKEYNQTHENKWFEPGMAVNEDCLLHEIY